MKPGDLRRFLEAGVLPSHDDDTASKIQLTNRLSLALAAVIAGASLLLYGIAHEPRVLTHLAPFSLGPFLVLALNAMQQHVAAKLYSAALYIFIIVFLSCLFGELTLAQINLIVFVAYPFLIFKRSERLPLVVAISFALIGYGLLEAFDYRLFFSLGFSPSLQEIFRTVILGIIIIENLILVGLFVRSVEQARALLAREKEKSDLLLLNVLPSSIAHRLKAGETVIADSYRNVTVLFADIEGFTPLTALMAPAEVVQMLDEFFTKLDYLVAARGMEKIKTIGDCYMVAAGIPTARDNHAHVAARLALDIQKLVATSPVYGRRLQVRIGLNSGPIVAGVIGRQKFIYDLWGDTVNTASRMESHGLPGAVQVTSSTRELLRDDFDFESRGSIDVKGKGLMEVFLLRERSPERGLDAKAAGTDAIA